jgi:hypothetical protein
MGLRTIPVLFEYLDLMRAECPDAWLINFANPAGMLAEAVINHGGWPRAVGICDSPASIQRGRPPGERSRCDRLVSGRHRAPTVRCCGPGHRGAAL